MIIIANPIYDSVFKFLMEDERVAKILLSALLKKEVKQLQMRRNEHCNLQQSRISLFRIDFSAVIAGNGGKEELVLIELQKTWLATETLRFRQYLGTQYLDKENVPGKNNPGGFGLPIISIYILGHKLGDLQQPVVYVRRRYLDYDGQQITEGVPDPFIESLTHDSIIVQIPFLQGKTRNHLERILHVFDQEYRVKADDHLLNIDEKGMTEEERLLVNRLVMAAASPDVRRQMQVEDEILSEIEARDTTIMMKDEEIKKKEQVIEQKEQLLEQNKQVIEQKNLIIKSTIKGLRERGMSLSEIASILSLSEEEVGKLSE